MKEDRRIIKCRDTLIVSGLGVMFFGFWSVIKSCLMLIFQRDELNDLLDNGLYDPDERWFVIPLYILICLLVIITRTYVGLSASADGHGRKKSIFYLIVAVLILLFEGEGTVSTIRQFSLWDFDKIVDKSIEVIIDITSYVILIQMIVSSIMLRIYEHKRKAEDEADE